MPIQEEFDFGDESGKIVPFPVQGSGGAEALLAARKPGKGPPAKAVVEGNAGPGEAAFRVPGVSVDVWKPLYAVSEVVREVAPWKKLFDGDWFGLKDRESRQKAIGSIMGNAGQVFGVHLYFS